MAWCALIRVIPVHRKVFLVRRIVDSRHVVIKQIPVDDLGKEERFSALNEVKVLAMLQHPNIIAYYDNFVDEKSLMIVMEYAPGGTLHDFIQERNSVLLDEDVCEAILFLKGEPATEGGGGEGGKGAGEM